jgi:hypothetical protein
MNIPKLGPLHALCVVFGLVSGILLVNCVRQSTDARSATDAPEVSLQEPALVVAAADTTPFPVSAPSVPEQPFREAQKPVVRFDRKGRCMQVIMVEGTPPSQAGCRMFAGAVDDPHQFEQYRARTRAQEERWKAQAP